MASVTKYTCDVCKIKITEEFMLNVQINGTYACETLELCSWECLKKFAKEKTR